MSAVIELTVDCEGTDRKPHRKLFGPFDSFGQAKTTLSERGWRHIEAFTFGKVIEDEPVTAKVENLGDWGNLP